MSMRSSLLGVAAALVFASGAAAETPNLGQSVTESDLALWDISVGPDGVGLPQSSGTAAQGKTVYEQKCELCHGKEASGGKNAALVSTKDRTVTNYVPHATTIFDFTRRALPWPQPKSLTAGENYGVTAYLREVAKIIGESDVSNAEKLAEVGIQNGAD